MNAVTACGLNDSQLASLVGQGEGLR